MFVCVCIYAYVCVCEYAFVYRSLSIIGLSHSVLEVANLLLPVVAGSVVMSAP